MALTHWDWGRYIDPAPMNNNIYIIDEITTANTLKLRHHIRKYHCNIINFFPIDLAKIALSFSFKPEQLDYKLQVFYHGDLYNLNDIDLIDLEKLTSEVIYATTIKTVSKDYLNAWVCHTREGL